MDLFTATPSAQIVVELVSSESARQLAETIVRAVRDGETVHWSKIVESVGLGVGTVMLGIGALYTVIPWVDQKREERRVRARIRELNNTFPASLIGSKLYIVVSEQDRGTWYLIDDRTNSRHWIENMETVKAMGWQRHKIKVPQARLDNSQDKYSLNIYRQDLIGD